MSEETRYCDECSAELSAGEEWQCDECFDRLNNDDMLDEIEYEGD